MEIVIPAGKRKTQHIDGRFMRVLNATGPFVITAEGVSTTTVRNREVVDLEKPRDVIIENINEHEITVQIEASAFRVSGIDQVLLADGSKIDFVDGAAIDVGQVQIAEDAEILIKDGSSVRVSNFPEQQEVVGLIDLGEVPPLKVSELPAVQLAEKVRLDHTGTANGLPAMTMTGNLRVISGNQNRKRLEIKADINNAGNIWIGANAPDKGIPLSRGEAWNDEITANLNVYGDVEADKIYILEKQ